MCRILPGSPSYFELLSYLSFPLPVWRPSLVLKENRMHHSGIRYKHLSLVLVLFAFFPRGIRGLHKTHCSVAVLSAPLKRSNIVQQAKLVFHSMVDEGVHK